MFSTAMPASVSDYRLVLLWRAACADSGLPHGWRKSWHGFSQHSFFRHSFFRHSFFRHSMVKLLFIILSLSTAASRQPSRFYHAISSFPPQAGQFISENTALPANGR